MVKVRLEISKGDEIRWLSHLDYARTMERALRRSKLPVAYSEGFNPHMKVAYASALGVGVASLVEYMDMELSTDMTLEEIKGRLAPQLPAGITLSQIKFIADRTPALMAVVNLAAYRIIVPLQEGAATDDFTERLKQFNAAAQVTYVKESPKGRREIDVKALLAEPVSARVIDKMTDMSLAIRITKAGSVKPGEVLAAMVTGFQLPIVKESAKIDRIGLYVADKAARLSPMEII